MLTLVLQASLAYLCNLLEVENQVFTLLLKILFWDPFSKM